MNDKIVLDFGSIVSQMESEGLRLLTVKDNNTLFVVDGKDNLYAIEPYYAGGYLDRFIGERNVVSFELVEQPVINFENWRKKFLDATWVKDFIERTVKIEYPDFEKTSPLHVIRSKPFMERAGVEQQHLYDFWFQNAKSIDMPIWEFMGMGSAEYEQWQRGELKLRDGSYHKMEPSYFQMSEEALSIARKILDPDCPEPYYILRPLFMKSIPGDKECFLGIDYEARERQIPAVDVLNEKNYFTVFDPGDDLIAVISAEDVLYKEDFAELMENCGMEATEGNLNKVWSVFPDNIASGSTLKDLALAAIHSSMAKEPLEFVFDDEIEISDDSQALEGYVWATDFLVDRLKAQEPPLEEDQFMENINFYPVYNMNSGMVSLEGHYYLEDAHYAKGRSFVLPLTPEETNRLEEAFEAYCLKREGKSCLEFVNESRRDNQLSELTGKNNYVSLSEQIQSADMLKKDFRGSISDTTEPIR